MLNVQLTALRIHLSSLYSARLDCMQSMTPLGRETHQNALSNRGKIRQNMSLIIQNITINSYQNSE